MLVALFVSVQCIYVSRAGATCWKISFGLEPPSKDGYSLPVRRRADQKLDLILTKIVLYGDQLCQRTRLYYTATIDRARRTAPDKICGLILEAPRNQSRIAHRSRQDSQDWRLPSGLCDELAAKLVVRPVDRHGVHTNRAPRKRLEKPLPLFFPFPVARVELDCSATCVATCRFRSQRALSRLIMCLFTCRRRMPVFVPRPRSRMCNG